MKVPSNIRRLLAYVVDSCVRGLLWSPVWFSFFMQAWQRSEVFVSWFLILGCAFLSYAYDVLGLFFFQRSLGKLMFGMKLVSVSFPDRGLTLSQALLRPLVDRFDVFFGLSLRAFSFLRLDRTHPSDWLAETKVVSFFGEAHKARRPVLFLMCLIWFGFAEFAENYHLVQSARFEKDGIWIQTESFSN